MFAYLEKFSESVITFKFSLSLYIFSKKVFFLKKRCIFLPNNSKLKSLSKSGGLFGSFHIYKKEVSIYGWKQRVKQDLKMPTFFFPFKKQIVLQSCLAELTYKILLYYI